MELLHYVVFANPIQSWLLAAGIAVAVYSVLTLTKRIVLRRLSSHAVVLTAVPFNGAIFALLASTRSIFLQLVSLSTSMEVLSLPPRISFYITRAAFVALLYQLCLWGNAAIRFWVEQDSKLANADGARTQSMRAIGFLSTILLYTVVLLWGLDNFGVNINTLVAGLGVGGIAVALAVQNILGDLFASLTIVLDKPFVLGDYIVVGEYKGTIEHVGLKTTRVRSQSGEQLIFPNSDLLQSRIRNYKRMQERRVCFTLGISYETPIEKVRAVPGLFRSIIESKPDTRFERAHLQQLGPSALDFEVVYWILDPDYLKYMNTHEAVNLEIMAGLQNAKVELAYPTRTVYVKNK